MSTATAWLCAGWGGAWGGAFEVGVRESGPLCLLCVGLEEFVHLLEHLFDAEADGGALFVEGVELGFDGAGVALVDGELFAEGGDLGLGGGAGFALALDDFDGAEDFLFE